MGNKSMIAAAAVLALVLLSACGSKQDDGGNGSGSAQTQWTGGNGQGNGQRPFNRQPADLLGKVKGINGNTITVYKSSFVPGQGGPGGRRNGGNPLASGGNAPRASGANGQGRFNMQNSFTEETTVVQVTGNTKIVKRVFSNNQMSEQELSIGDLKEGDVLSVDLKDGTQEAVTITLNNGGFGGRGPNRDSGQETSSAPAP